MKIGIFANSQNSQAQSIYNRISNNHEESQVHYFDISVSPNDSISLDESGIYWNDINIAQLDLAYLHGFSYQNPVVPLDTGMERDYSIWQQDYLIDQQKYSFLLSVFRDLDQRGVKLVNSPESFVVNFMKPYFLEQLRHKGFNIPKMICSNDMASVQSFCNANQKTVWRPTTGRASWQLFLDKQRISFVKPDLPPVLLAELIQGPLIRGYFFEGDPLLFLKFTTPECSPEEHLEIIWSEDCPDAEHELKRFFSASEVLWALFYFIPSNGRIWIYDVDTDPVLNWLPEPYMEYLLNQLVLKLTGKEQDIASTLKKTSPKERPTMFLRRMLRILFDFERSKYTDT